MSKRKITIETRGPIRFKSGVVGPITVPYLEEVGLIARMVVAGIKVVEHKENGDKVLLGTKDLKDLTANTKVIKENRLQAAERTGLQNRLHEEQQKVQAAKAEKLEAAKAELAGNEPKKEEVVAEEATKKEQLSKKERKEQARLLAEAAKVNSQQEDAVEAK